MSNFEKSRDKLTRDIKNKIENALIRQEANLKSTLNSIDVLLSSTDEEQEKLNTQVPQNALKTTNESDNSFFKDEESMIPKGLLDVPCDKNEGRYPVPADNSTSSGAQQGIPCFIALFPAGNVNDWYHMPFGNANGSYTYPPPPIPPTPIGGYMRSQGNEYYRNMRGVSSSNSRTQQSLEYAWWNGARTCPNFYNPYPNLEVKTYNCQRNINPLFGFDAYQQVSFNRYPIEIPSFNSNINPNMLYSFDNNYFTQDSFQIPYSKTFYKNNTKVVKECQTENNSNVVVSKDSVENMNSASQTIASSSEDSSLSQSKECPFVMPNDQEHGNSLNDSSSLPEDNCEKDTFQYTALYSCLQLEQILSSTEIESELDLKECCVRMKSELSKLKHYISAEAILKEMIFSLFHICNAWTSLTSIKDACKGLNRSYSFDSLIESFETWESKSKTLLENLMSSVQYESEQNNNKKCVSSDFKPTESNGVNDDKTSSIIDVNNKEYLSRNINSNESDRTKISEICEPNKEINQHVGQLSPETYRLQKSFKSEFIFDNFVKDLKKSQEEGCKRKCDKNVFPCQMMKTKQSSCTNNVSSKNEGLDLKLEINRDVKSNNEFEVTNNSLLHKNEPLSTKRDRNSRNTTESLKSVEDKNIRLNTKEDTSVNSKFKVEKSSVLGSENQKYPAKIDWAFDKFQTGGKTMENDLSPSQSKTNDLGSSRRYSLRHKRKNRTVNSFKNNDQCSKENYEFNNCISINTKLKLYDIILGIESFDLKPLISQKVTDVDISTIRQSIINPLMNIGHSLSRNIYKNINDVIDDVYALFYRAKRENKGNIVVLTAVNRLELRLMNIMFEEIGTC